MCACAITVLHENSYMRTTFHRTYNGLHYITYQKTKKEENGKNGPKKEGYQEIKRGYQKNKKGYLFKWGKCTSTCYQQPIQHNLL